MRIAVSGSHRTGKSSLVAELGARLPRYTVIEEPYHLMEEEGHDFAHPPSVEDFVAQLERSLDELDAGGEDVLFDRSPVDFLAYLAVHDDAGDFDRDDWLPRIRDAVQSLELIVLVPVEARDRIRFSSSDDDGETRDAVDRQLKDILLEDPFELGVDVLEVEGDLEARTRMVLKHTR